MYGGSILLPPRICWIYSKSYFYFNLEDSGLNHRKHIGVQEAIYNSNKDFKCWIWSNTIFGVVFCNCPATFSVSNTWTVCSLFLRRVIMCSHRVYLRILLVLRRGVIRPWRLIISLHKYPVVYEKSTTITKIICARSMVQYFILICVWLTVQCFSFRSSFTINSRISMERNGYTLRPCRRPTPT